MPKSTFSYVSYIRTTPRELWDALTSVDAIEKYRFGMLVESEWKPGAPWTMSAQGRLMDGGDVVDVLPRERLSMTWRCEWNDEFKAEGSTLCVYVIEEAGSATKLTVTHSSERPESRFIAAVADGWPMVISNLKSLLETGRVALTFQREAT